MEITVEHLARQGIKNILVCLYRHPDRIESYFGNGQRWGVSINYILLNKMWGNAGALHWVKSLISEDFIVSPADAIVDFDGFAILNDHRAHNNIATVIVHQACIGYDDANDEQKANRYLGNIPETYGEKVLYETGVYLFRPQALDFIPVRTYYDIHTQLLPALSAAGLPIGVSLMDGYWNRLESFHDIQEAQKTYLYSAMGQSTEHEPGDNHLSYPFISGRYYAPGIWVGKNNNIHPSVDLVAPVLLGDNIRIGQGVVVGPEVVIGANVILDDEATIHYSTVFDHTYVGQLAHVQNRLVDKNLLIDVDSSDCLRIVDKFLLRDVPRSLEHTIFARISDTLLSGLFLLLTAPLILPIGLFLFILSGKIFQPVPRLNNKPAYTVSAKSSSCSVVNLWRFRTRDAAGKYTILGKFLERMEWHRLPELWNVLKGDIRLVGVKPLTREEAEQLREEWQKKRDDYYSGFTGLWFIQTGCDSELNEILVADVCYVATRTCGEDLRIVCKTPRAWLDRIRKHNLYFR